MSAEDANLLRLRLIERLLRLPAGQLAEVERLLACWTGPHQPERKRRRSL